MVFDYRDSLRAYTAQQVLEGAGVPTVYILEKLVPVSDDPAATLWLVHRVTVPEADAVNAVAVLDEHGLVPGPAR